MSDDEFDEARHERLLDAVLDRKQQVPVRKSFEKISSNLLVKSVKNAKLATGLAKRKLELERKEAEKFGTSLTIAVPVHRQASERIKGAVGFIELKKDLKFWDDIVKKNRLADQLNFPWNEDVMLTTEKAADRAEAFKAKNDFEKRMVDMWNGSKNNMTNDTMYTEAELEIIKAMDVKEAKERLNQMQKMRALISYREAKYRYAAKIKSKGYHRILKRQKRKQLIKEFDELLIRDPEAAKVKLKELENQRIIERGSLKHRARTKFQRDIVKYAGRDPRAKKVLEEHLRLGRELKSKVSAESNDEEEEEKMEEQPTMSVSEMIKSAALAASKSGSASTALSNDNNQASIALFELRARKRSELQAAKSRAVGKPASPKPVFEQNNEWYSVAKSKDSLSQCIDENQGEETQNKSQNTNSEIKTEDKKERLCVNTSKTLKKKVKKPKRTTAAAKTEDCTTEDIDRLFNAAEEQLVVDLKKVAEKIRDEDKGRRTFKKKRVAKVLEKAEDKEKQDVEDISIDPKIVLQAETTNLSKVSSELVDRMDEFDQDQAHVVAEAFKDDDVIGDFAEEKEIVEEGERPKDIDLTLPGWGCWVGPGITDRKRRKQFIIKAKEKKRKDRGRPCLIIKEMDETSISRLQPTSLPFPYTSVVDFEAVVSQPIGKEWNTIGTVQEICRPAIVTKGGRPILPLCKTDILAGKLDLD